MFTIFRTRFFCVCLLLACLLACDERHSAVSSVSPVAARTLNPDYTGSLYDAVAQRYWLWGSQSSLRWSENGHNWITIETSHASSIQSVASDEKNGIMIALAGYTLLRSNDAGSHWQPVSYAARPTSLAQHNFKKVIFLAEFSLWCVLGEKGRFLLSRDHGATWEAISLGPQLAGVALETIGLTADRKRLLLGGEAGLFGYSDDAGESWQLLPLAMDTPITQFYPVGERIVATSTGGKFLISTDRGLSWENFESDGQAYFTDGIYLAETDALLLITHNGKLLRGTQHASQWQMIGLPYNGSLQYLSRVFMQSDKTLQLVGHGGAHFISHDGGNEWLAQTSNITFENIQQNKSGDKWIAYGRGGLLAHKVNNDKQWNTIFPQADVYWRNGLVTTQGSWILAGELGLILRSTNKGADWQQVFVNYSDPNTPPTFRALIQEPLQQALIAAGPTGTIIRSQDDGLSWQTVYYSIFAEGEAFTELLIEPNTRHLVAIEAWGRHRLSRDGGNTWQAVATKNQHEFWSGAVLDRNGTSVMIMAGQAGAVARSDDAGLTWNVITAADNVDWFGGYADSRDQQLFLLGAKGKLNRSHDGGKSWQPLMTGVATDLRRMLAHSPTGNLLAFGAEGVILLSQDQGANWQQVNAGVSGELRDGKIDTDGRIFLVGEEGALISSIDGGFSWITESTNTRAHFRSLLVDKNKILPIGQRITLIEQ